MLEKHFSYYRNEEECPFEHSSNEAIFWQTEKTYNVTVVKKKDQQYEESLLNSADSLAKTLQSTAKTDLQKKFLTYSREKKALALYVGDMLKKFCPMDGDSILINY